jgi:hypothetical protein
VAAREAARADAEARFVQALFDDAPAAAQRRRR